MNLKSILFGAALLGSALVVQASEKIVGGPKGGRLLEAGTLKAEFFVTKDHKAEIIYYDGGPRPVSPGNHVAAITAEAPSGRKRMELEPTPTGFISTTALPVAEKPYRVVVQLREQSNAAPKNYRIDLDLTTCGECQRAEYACTCGH